MQSKCKVSFLYKCLIIRGERKEELLTRVTSKQKESNFNKDFYWGSYGNSREDVYEQYVLTSPDIRDDTFNWFSNFCPIF